MGVPTAESVYRRLFLVLRVPYAGQSLLKSVSPYERQSTLYQSDVPTKYETLGRRH